MSAYALKRLLRAVPVVIGATFVVFLLAFAVPGDPAQALAGERAADPAFTAVIEAKYHLDEPLLQQYGRFLLGAVQGDFGETYSGQQVSGVLADRFAVSLRLATTALVIEAVLGIGLGVVAALRRDRFADHAIRLLSLVALSLPFFVTAFVLQFLLGARLELFPVAGIEDGLRSYLLPGFVLASFSIAYVTRLTRSSLLDSLSEQYVKTAVAKGVRWRTVVTRHGLRNSMIPVVTFLGLEFGAMLNATVIIESIFNLPGVGQGLARAIYLGERTMIVGIVTALVLVYIVLNLIIDLLYAVLDPRIRYE
ncbi:ABC transporter permease [Wenjunlia vitaminophila]|uniref:ABC transporter permease n=1 Tax=Wenjunlia vitaminophila TaxID=76728 RepID=A0A0T6LKE7_WENVI|nr:ABC transporter permease [Wenjunlia vitaminophila]KRV46573.1 ABC transporter permease [Wenjunlia vitaminophila]